MPQTELILIVDDVLDNLKVLSGLLKESYRIRVATTGEEALRLASDAPLPDLILLDIMMPGMDGFSVCERLKALPSTADIPVIFLTAKTASEDETRGFEVGGVDFVAKPINPAVLRARVKAQLALSAQLRDSRRQLSAADRRLIQISDARDRSELERQHLHDRQQALLSIARAALGDLTLSAYLARMLEAIDAIPWLEVEPRGALFMLNRRHELVLVARYRLDDVQDRICHNVQQGRCVCQRVAANGRPAFVPRPGRADAHCIMGQRGRGSHSLPLVEGERVYGVLSVLTPAEHRPLDGELEFMQDVAQTFTSLVRRKVAEETVRISQLETQIARNEVIRRLGIAAEFRDTETGLHIVRMSKYAKAIAVAMGCDSAFCELVELAATMHDIGKIGIDDSILRKPDRLTAEEFGVMQGHTLIGARILEGEDALICMAREIALSHHERWDGKGYPNAAREEVIPLSGRICAVADVFDALTMERPYKSAWPVERAVAEIKSSSGTAFDPAVVAAFVHCLPEIIATKARYHDETIDPREVLPTSDNSRDDDWIKWHDGFAVGIAIIDEHHRYLLSWTNRVHRALRADTDRIEVAKALFALEDYVRIHFRAEERLMAERGYPDFHAHRQSHRDFETELRELRTEISHNPFIAGMEMLEFLRAWLLEHILRSDRDMAATLSATQR